MDKPDESTADAIRTAMSFIAHCRWDGISPAERSRQMRQVRRKGLRRKKSKSRAKRTPKPS